MPAWVGLGGETSPPINFFVGILIYERFIIVQERTMGNPRHLCVGSVAGLSDCERVTHYIRCPGIAKPNSPGLSALRLSCVTC